MAIKNTIENLFANKKSLIGKEYIAETFQPGFYQGTIGNITRRCKYIYLTFNDGVRVKLAKRSIVIFETEHSFEINHPFRRGRSYRICISLK